MNRQNVINYAALWDRVAGYAKKIGKAGSRPVLLLYYVLRSPDVPRADKLLVISALSYLVLPIDLLSARRLPVIGWIDEIVSLTIAYQKVRKYITPEIEAEADKVLGRWFPDIGCTTV